MSRQHTETTDRDHGFVRALGTVDALFIGFGAMIGFGWVVLTGEWLNGGEIENTEPLFTGGGAGFIGVMAVVPFLFVGFDVIPQSAEEVKLPPAKIGKLVVISVVMAIAFYVIIIGTTSLAMPADQLGSHDLVTADALSIMFGSTIWGKIVIAGGLAGIITSWNAFLMGSSRLMWAMATAGMIPKWFGKLHPKYRTPSNAIIFIGILSAIAPFFGTAALGWIVDAGSPAIVIAYFLVSVGFLVLRKREPDMERPLRIGGARSGGFVIGVISSILTFILFILYLPITPVSAQLAWQSWLGFALWLAVGIYFMFRLPTGIKPGPNAENELLAKVKSLRKK